MDISAQKQSIVLPNLVFLSFDINEISKFFRMAFNMTIKFDSFLYQMPTVDYCVVLVYKQLKKCKFGQCLDLLGAGLEWKSKAPPFLH